MYVLAGLMEYSDKPFTKDDAIRALAILFDYMYLMDEMTCVNGTVTFFDISHYSLRVHAGVPLDDRKEFGETWQVYLDELINFNQCTI